MLTLFNFDLQTFLLFTIIMDQLVTTRHRFFNFKTILNQCHNWYFFIHNYKIYSISDTLLYHISTNSNFLIFIDGSKTYNKSGDCWIILLQDETKLISGWNPEFERNVDIKSYHSKIYASLELLTFFEFYSDLFSPTPLNNTIHTTCDNKSYVTKIKTFQSNSYSKLIIHKIKEYEPYLSLLAILPSMLLYLMSKVSRIIIKIIQTLQPLTN